MEKQVLPYGTAARNHKDTKEHSLFRAFLLFICILVTFIASVLISLPVLAAPVVSCNFWEPVGSYISPAAGPSTAMALGSGETPYVVYIDGANSNVATVVKYNGSSWVPVGGGTISAPNASYVSIAIDNSDNIYVAYADGSNGGKATVKEYTGGAWVLVGGGPVSAGTGYYTKIAIDGSGHPYVMFQDGAAGGGPSVYKFGGVWDIVGLAPILSTPPGSSPNESIAIAPDGTIYIMFLDPAAGNAYLVYYFTAGGSYWQQHDIEVAGYTSATLTVDGSSNVYVGYVDPTSAYNSSNVFKCAPGSFSWDRVSGAAFQNDTADHLAMTVDASGNIYVAYEDYGIGHKAAVMKWDGSTWATLGNAGFSGSAGSSFSIVAPGPGHVFVGYNDGPDGGSSFNASVVQLTTPAIMGSSTVVEGSSISLSDGVPGGTWSSDNTAVATVNASGTVSGMAAGIATISYVVSGCTATKQVTVTAAPSGGICVGSTTLLSGGSGGVWSSSNIFVATVSTAGVVTGVGAGTATISHTVGGVVTPTAVTVNALPSGIGGATSVCAGSDMTVSDFTPGGTWSASNANVSINGTGGVTGVIVGTSVISYTLPTGCYRTLTETVKPLPAAISGTASVCVGGTTFLSDATTGGISWTSSNTSVATIGGSGVVTGIAAGTTTISYTIGTGCRATRVVTVNGLPPAVTGNAPVCAGATETLSDPSALTGTWSSSNSAVATIGSSTGIVNGIAGGTASVTFADANGCKASVIVTVNAILAITGAPSACLGGTTTLADGTTGGTWSSDNIAVATVGLTTGVVSGAGAGTANITYALPSGCNRAVTVTITSMTPISATNTTVCIGLSAAFTDATPSGAWTSSSVGIAAVSTGGTVTGVSAGTANITYSLSGCSTTKPVTVVSAPSGIGGTNRVCISASITMSDFTPGGTWSSTSGVSVVSTGTASSLVTGISVGTATVTYSLGGTCYRTYTLSVNALPASISGPSSVCVGSKIFLTDATTPGLSWTSSSTSVATITASGAVTGVSAGTATMTYTVPSGCNTTSTITVNALPVVGAIAGPSTVSMAGAPVLFTDGTSGGVWSSNHATVISIDAGGLATALASSGVTTIAYTVTDINGCLATATKNVSASPAPHGTSGGGTTTTTVGQTLTLATEAIAGEWTSSDNTVATVDNSGTLTAIAPGAVSVIHTVYGNDGTASSTAMPVVVNALPLDLNILPNPNKGTFTVKASGGYSPMMFEITNMLGMVVYHHDANVQDGSVNEVVELGSNLANGMYLLNVVCGTEHKALHFVIEK